MSESYYKKHCDLISSAACCDNPDILYIALTEAPDNIYEFYAKSYFSFLHDKNTNIGCVLSLMLACNSSRCLNMFINDAKIIAQYEKSINTLNRHGYAPIHIAIIKKEFELLKFLLKIPSIDVNLETESQKTPMSLAIDINDQKFLEILINDARTDVNKKFSKCKCTIAHYCIAEGTDELLKILIKSGRVDFNIKNLLKETPICVAAKRDKCSMLRELLNIPEVLVNDSDVDPLENAASLNQFQAFKILYRCGRAKFDNYKLLCMVTTSISRKDITDFISYLLDQPEVDTCKDIDGMTYAQFCVKQINMANRLCKIFDNPKVNLKAGDMTLSKYLMLALTRTDYNDLVSQLLRCKRFTSDMVGNMSDFINCYIKVRPTPFCLMRAIYDPRVDINKPSSDGILPIVKAYELERNEFLQILGGHYKLTFPDEIIKEKIQKRLIWWHSVFKDYFDVKDKRFITDEEKSKIFREIDCITLSPPEDNVYAFYYNCKTDSIYMLSTFNNIISLRINSERLYFMPYNLHVELAPANIFWATWKTS